MTTLLLTLILLGEPPTIDHIPYVEINHVSGRFTQLIYRDRAGFIRDWRVLNDPKMLPGRDGLAAWNDQGTWRTIRAERIYETYTEYDPEVVDRKWRPESLRRKLGAPND